jgi:hypothetical protein
MERKHSSPVRLEVGYSRQLLLLRAVLRPAPKRLHVQHVHAPAPSPVPAWKHAHTVFFSIMRCMSHAHGMHALLCVYVRVYACVSSVCAKRDKLYNKSWRQLCVHAPASFALMRCLFCECKACKCYVWRLINFGA